MKREGIYKRNKVLHKPKEGEEKYIPTWKRRRSSKGTDKLRKYGDYSLKYLGRMAGVSSTTIANIWNEPWKVSEGTRYMITDKLKEFGINVPQWDGDNDEI